MIELKELDELLKDEINNILTALDGSLGLRDLVQESLSQRKRVLNTDNDIPWPLLSLIVSESINGEYSRALPAAAAFQLLLAAGDVFDDIEDADSNDSIYSRYGLSVATSVANTLLILGERTLTRLKMKGLDTDTIFQTIDIVNSFYTAACIGQHMDLTIETQLSESEDIYFKIIIMKSAGQIECACQIGALLAKASQELIEAFALFGRNVGIASQISNDISGITNGNDIVKKKITLPVIYALNLPDDNISDKLMRVFQKKPLSIEDIEMVKQLLFHTGAIHYATLKMNLYKQKASDVLSEIARNNTNIERLKLFVV